MIFYTGYVLAVVSPLLLAPALALWLARALRPFLRWIRPVEGALAADSLLQSPRRTSATVSALMLSLALAVGFAGVSGAVYGLVNEWIRTRLSPDLFVVPTENLASRQFRFPASMQAELERVPGVEEVQPTRSVRLFLGDVPLIAIAADIAALDKRVPFKATEGDPREMVRLASLGRGVIISDTYALLRRVHPGDSLDIPTPRGILRLPVAGVTIDFSGQQGSFFIARKVFVDYWGDDTVGIFRVFVRRGADPMAVRKAILTRFSTHSRLFVLTNADIREFILRSTANWLDIANVQLAVAVLVAMLGIVNALTVSIMDRRRELGVLQAVGALRNQVRQAVWMEAAAIGLVGILLGTALGAMTLYYNLDMLRRDIGGLRLQYQFPLGFSLQLFPLILAAAWLSSIWPAEAAVRASLVESLEYE
jgi:putative ABC transport system permease protein